MHLRFWIFFFFWKCSYFFFCNINDFFVFDRHNSRHVTDSKFNYYHNHAKSHHLLRHALDNNKLWSSLICYIMSMKWTYNWWYLWWLLLLNQTKTPTLITKVPFPARETTSLTATSKPVTPVTAVPTFLWAVLPVSSRRTFCQSKTICYNIPGLL